MEADKIFFFSIRNLIDILMSSVIGNSEAPDGEEEGEAVLVPCGAD